MIVSGHPCGAGEGRRRLRGRAAKLYDQMQTARPGDWVMATFCNMQAIIEKQQRDIAALRDIAEHLITAVYAHQKTLEKLPDEVNK